jgi:hypothetical protein
MANTEDRHPWKACLYPAGCTGCAADKDVDYAAQVALAECPPGTPLADLAETAWQVLGVRFDARRDATLLARLRELA